MNGFDRQTDMPHAVMSHSSIAKHDNSDNSIVYIYFKLLLQLINYVSIKLTWKEFLNSVLAEKLDHVSIDAGYARQTNSIRSYVCRHDGWICQPCG